MRQYREAKGAIQHALNTSTHGLIFDALGEKWVVIFNSFTHTHTQTSSHVVLSVFLMHIA